MHRTTTPATSLNIFYCKKHDNIMACFFVGFMVFNTTFNNISVISWRSVLLVEETEGPVEKPPTYRKSLTNFIT